MHDQRATVAFGIVGKRSTGFNWRVPHSVNAHKRTRHSTGFLYAVLCGFYAVSVAVATGRIAQCAHALTVANSRAGLRFHDNVSTLEERLRSVRRKTHHWQITPNIARRDREPLENKRKSERHFDSCGSREVFVFNSELMHTFANWPDKWALRTAIASRKMSDWRAWGRKRGREREN